MIIMLIDMINLANYKNACDSIICLYSTIYLFKLAYLIRLYIFPDTNLSAMHNIYIYICILLPPAMPSTVIIPSSSAL